MPDEIEQTQALEPPIATATAPEDQTSSVGVLEETGNQPGLLANQKMMKDMVIGVVMVLFIGFAASFISVITLWVQSLNEKSSSISELTSQVQEQNRQISDLKKELHEQRDEQRKLLQYFE